MKNRDCQKTQERENKAGRKIRLKMRRKEQLALESKAPGARGKWIPAGPRKNVREERHDDRDI